MTKRPNKGSPHSLRISEANGSSDHFNRLVALFDLDPGGFSSQLLDRFSRSLPCLCQEHSSKLART
jgi:hypothetical protein